jgi:hypothetical protein
MINCYKVLGVPDFASIEEIKTAYRKLSKKFHPDVNDGDKFFEERFKEIQYAYETLSDASRKNILDNFLKNAGNNFNHRQQRSSSYTEEKKSTAGKSTETHTPKYDADAVKETIKTFGNKIPAKRIAGFGLSFLVILIIVLAKLWIKESNRSRYIPNDNPVQYSVPNDNSNQTTTEPVYSTVEPSTNSELRVTMEDLASQTSGGDDNHFSVGSTPEEVLHIQGNPSGINKYESMGVEVWSYGFSTVRFKNGRVNEYQNTSDNLKVTMTASTGGRKGGSFTVGSTKEEVLKAQGDPSGINKYEMMGEEVWSFAFSTVRFKNGVVKEYQNTSDNLRVTMASSNSGKSEGYFTIGSSTDDVLNVQGAPSGINKCEMMDKEVWSYGFSTVSFKSGKVTEYQNTSSNLKVRM